MSIKKIIITKGIYLDKELRLLVSFDENDKALDIINLDRAFVGTMHEATVEKVLSDINACILKLDCGEKGFIENKRLVPTEFIERHSDKKLVCQADKFYVSISQDRKGSKPYSCHFVKTADFSKDQGFIGFFIDEFCLDHVEIITDLPEISELDYNVRYYSDEAFSLWQLYGLTTILDEVLNKCVYLKSGGNIVIEPTEALTVIDVNSGRNSGKTDAMKTNVEAISAAIRQIRLRSISGIIIMDLLKVAPGEEDKLLEIAEEEFSSDYSIVDIHGFTKLGLLEITRSRMFAPFSI